MKKEFEGETFGEYFGAAICVMDVNGDGYDDVLVGAPRFSRTEHWDQGRVYIYQIGRAHV